MDQDSSDKRKDHETGSVTKTPESETATSPATAMECIPDVDDSNAKDNDGDNPEDPRDYDELFKLLFSQHPQLVIPLVNVVFGCSYSETASFELLNTTHMDALGYTYSDATFKIDGTVYHFECQSASGAHMDRRMLRYDFAISLEQLGTNKLSKVGLNHPASCLINLRHRRKGKPVEFPVRYALGHDGKYKYLVLNVQAYSLDDIFQKNLLILFPFFLMRYDKEKFTEVAANKSLTKSLARECKAARKRLAREMRNRGESALYYDLIQYAVEVSDILLKGHPELNEKVRRAMGGKHVEILSERLKRKDKELVEKDEKIDEQAHEIKESKKTIGEQAKEISEQAKKIENLEDERDAAISKAKERASERDAAISKTIALESEVRVLKQQNDRLLMMMAQTGHPNMQQGGLGTYAM